MPPPPSPPSRIYSFLLLSWLPLATSFSTLHDFGKKGSNFEWGSKTTPYSTSRYLEEITSKKTLLPNLTIKTIHTNLSINRLYLLRSSALFSAGGRDDFTANDSDDDDEVIDALNEEDIEKRRMEIVRTLQRTYYRSVDDGIENSETLLDPDSLAGGSKVGSNVGSKAGSKTSNSGEFAKLDPSSGKIVKLPLWRVGWVETPGRRNCLNVHEGHYTHMFETILSSPFGDKSTDAGLPNDTPPLYFGHLYLPGGSKSAKSGEERYRLKTWREELLDERRFDASDGNGKINHASQASHVSDRSAVIGCLMQIIDHRRMDDGRLMILVQALERFVVEEVIQTRPYSVANVRILLDSEDLDLSSVQHDEDQNSIQRTVSKSQIDENFFQHFRAKAVTSSFGYHDYEFNKPKLPISNDSSPTNQNNDETYLSKEEIPWIGISKLLPFAEYNIVNEDNDDGALLEIANQEHHNAQSTASSLHESFASGELPIEQQLYNGGILWDPPPMSQVIQRRQLTGSSTDSDTNCDVLETLLWLALDDFCQATGFVMPLELACLIPPNMRDYLLFVIPPSASASASASASSASASASSVSASSRHTSSNFPQLSPKYPKLRRQRRLSYLAPALIENSEVGSNMRQTWLNCPSTKSRLLGVLERFDYLNNQLMGQFE